MDSAPTFRFVAQPGSLAHRSRFLAASLRRFAPAGSVLEACVPAGHDLDATTLAAFEAMGVAVRRFEPEIWRRHDYPIGNKVEAACLPASTPQTLLLDSDIVAIRPLATAELAGVQLGMRTIMARQVFGRGHRRAIGRFVEASVRVPGGPALQRHLAIRSPARVGFPVFNSGVVLFPEGGDLARRLRELTVAALESPDLPEAVRRPFADQLALACLALEHPERVTVLPEHWNCAINAPPERASLWHYFAFTRLAQTGAGRELIGSLQAEFAGQGINLLGEWTGRDVWFARPRRRRAPGK
jgi:hypothetical protein